MQMASVTHRADIKLASATLQAIDAATQRAADDGLRPHLGASVIGRACERQLWYGFRWALPVQHEARMLRLFERGQREEANLVALLRQAGVTVHTVDPATGRQFAFGQGSHFGGSMDGAAVGLPDAPKTWHVLEFKTAGKKAFDALAKHGVQQSKPEHWAQMQCYMAWTGMTRALYMAVCKDDDRLHLERIDADKDAAALLFAKAERIVNAAAPPDGVSDEPDYYLCKLCDYRDACHGTRTPQANCRTCLHSTAVPGGQWTCARRPGQALPVATQKRGCTEHRLIPALLGNWAEPTDASEADNWVRYRIKSGSGEIVNGAPPHGYSSAEIAAAADKQALAVVAADLYVQQLREQFGAQLMNARTEPEP